MGGKVDGKADVNPSGQCIILCGTSGSGKTSLLLSLIEELRPGKIDFAGVLSPPVKEHGVKTGIDLLNLRTWQRFRLASLKTADNPGIGTIKWQFDPNILEMGNQILGEAVPCDILVVDELGPIEFTRGEGWQNGFVAIVSRAYRLALLVIRPDLIDQALWRWPNAQVIKVNCESQAITISALHDEICRLVPGK